MVVQWDAFDHRGEDNEIAFAVYQTENGVVIKATLQGKLKPEEIEFSFSGDKVNIEGNSTFEKMYWRGSKKKSEIRSYPVFTKTIPLDIPADTEAAKVSYGPDVWTLTIPRKREEE